VNVLLALLDQDHVHYRTAIQWFSSPDLQWALCPFTEAGFLRNMIRPKVGNISVGKAVSLLERFAQRPGYHYLPISADWRELCKPFSERIFGHNQITDAYLLGLAIREDLVLVTFDKAILHMAGEHRGHVLLLTE
jgi:predicted nucleic acid-binding protein